MSSVKTGGDTAFAPVRFGGHTRGEVSTTGQNPTGAKPLSDSC